eukprot:CAMPEP_0170463734 /NCGR_PEP_ID=MMETSP0123-20130129/8734_1 /TAXON_ID=182087 /ORGANISM="Favella ehrenbergii, Strain Fehren 1" /LENGTH=77 /DNA_ID=CAMNT_0010729239 /DNA_START=1276 /DNA_END=1509 /DNA_ORIENTATION=-
MIGGTTQNKIQKKLNSLLSQAQSNHDDNDHEGALPIHKKTPHAHTTKNPRLQGNSGNQINNFTSTAIQQVSNSGDTL